MGHYTPLAYRSQSAAPTADAPKAISCAKAALALASRSTSLGLVQACDRAEHASLSRGRERPHRPRLVCQTTHAACSSDVVGVAIVGVGVVPAASATAASTGGAIRTNRVNVFHSATRSCI